MTPVRLEPAALRSRVKHSTTEPLRSLTGEWNSFDSIVRPSYMYVNKDFFLNFLQAFKEEEKEYADLKKNLRVSIRDMRRTVSIKFFRVRKKAFIVG